MIMVLLNTRLKKSYTSNDCVSYLKLNKIREEVIAYGLFGGIETIETQQNEYQIRIEDIDSTVRIPVLVNDHDKCSNNVPRQ